MIFSLGLDCSVWDQLSQVSNKYVAGECQALFSGFTTKQYTLGTLFYWCKEDSPENYAELKRKYNFESVFDKPIINNNIEYTDINERYLLDKIEQTYTITKCMKVQLDRLFNDNNVKSLNIKSQYGTSKTQLLIKAIEQYPSFSKRILFLSYRKTLTYDLQYNFSSLGFETYLEGSLNSDRLIIQLESLLKLDWINCSVVPKYDLVIMDESESCLNQFSSDTFKGDSRNAYEYLRAIIENSSKLITLDGDQSNRTYSFVSSFEGQCININNTVKFNTKTLLLTEKEGQFKDDIYQKLSDNKRIVIVSMSATIAEQYYQEIINKYPQKKVMIYTGKTDDDIKTEHSKNVKESWIQYDVVLYSPTFEAGVNFDVLNHFYCAYCIVSAGSTSQRACFQMLSRVRNYESDNILIYTNNLKDLPISDFYNFEEVKQSLIDNRDKILKYSYVKENNELTRVLSLDSYDTNTIYNRTEELNKNKSYFLPYFKQLAINKGFQIKNIDDPFDEEEEELKNSNEGKYDELLNAPDIDSLQFKQLIKLQERGKAKRADKIKIEKEVYKRKLGVDQLNENLLKTFYKKE